MQKRKTNELGIKNLEYVQGDILDIYKLGKTFDVIECSGVLHHMKNPEKGLSSLVKVLRPGGMLKLALYSEIGRSTGQFNAVSLIERVKITKDKG